MLQNGETFVLLISTSPLLYFICWGAISCSEEMLYGMASPNVWAPHSPVKLTHKIYHLDKLGDKSSWSSKQVVA
jgi:hypothetical protein